MRTTRIITVLLAALLTAAILAGPAAAVPVDNGRHGPARGPERAAGRPGRRATRGLRLDLGGDRRGRATGAFAIVLGGCAGVRRRRGPVVVR